MTAISTGSRQLTTDPKAALAKLNQNLNILQEWAAKYGGNAPLKLLNQLDDHRQAITGELTAVKAMVRI